MVKFPPADVFWTGSLCRSRFPVMPACSHYFGGLRIHTYWFVRMLDPPPTQDPFVETAGGSHYPRRLGPSWDGPGQQQVVTQNPTPRTRPTNPTAVRCVPCYLFPSSRNYMVGYTPMGHTHAGCHTHPTPHGRACPRIRCLHTIPTHPTPHGLDPLTPFLNHFTTHYTCPQSHCRFPYTLPHPPPPPPTFIAWPTHGPPPPPPPVGTFTDWLLPRFTVINYRSSPMDPWCHPPHTHHYSPPCFLPWFPLPAGFPHGPCQPRSSHTFTTVDHYPTYLFRTYLPVLPIQFGSQTSAFPTEPTPWTHLAPTPTCSPAPPPLGPDIYRFCLLPFLPSYPALRNQDGSTQPDLYTHPHPQPPPGPHLQTPHLQCGLVLGIPYPVQTSSAHLPPSAQRHTTGLAHWDPTTVQLYYPVILPTGSPGPAVSFFPPSTLGLHPHPPTTQSPHPGLGSVTPHTRLAPVTFADLPHVILPPTPPPQAPLPPHGIPATPTLVEQFTHTTPHSLFCLCKIFTLSLPRAPIYLPTHPTHSHTGPPGPLYIGFHPIHTLNSPTPTPHTLPTFGPLCPLPAVPRLHLPPHLFQGHCYLQVHVTGYPTAPPHHGSTLSAGPTLRKPRPHPAGTGPCHPHRTACDRPTPVTGGHHACLGPHPTHPMVRTPHTPALPWDTHPTHLS